MVEIELNGKKEFAYLVKKGEVNNIVLPFNRLSLIDYKRIKAIAARSGEFMTNLRETTLDNGVNALVLYSGLFISIPVDVPAEKQPEAPKASGDLVTGTVKSAKPKAKAKS